MEAAAGNSTSKVRVAARVRPFLARDVNPHVQSTPVSCVSVAIEEPGDKEVTVSLKDPLSSRSECYKLDAFFDQQDYNVAEIFNSEVSPMVPAIFRGQNATVFAYGATGSGKTYTMQGSDEKSGIMTLAMSRVLDMSHRRTGASVEMSYYEVYMDRCYDLLEVKAKEILVWDDKDKNVHLRGLSQVSIKSMSDFQEVFSLGVQRRKVAHTGLNDVSSRSHGVLVIYVTIPVANGSGFSISGKMNLIDLAGNEDSRKTCNEGIRLQESAKINQSLFALSNVIFALNNKNPRVPYRESKLTRILQDSLGGTSQALMIACLNPGEYQECVHTVSLAARSRQISNSVSSAQKQATPAVKVDMQAKLQAWLESKGKMKSTQRFGAFASPVSSQTPGRFSSMKKSSAFMNSTKTKAAHNQASEGKHRVQAMPCKNLFDNRQLDDSCWINASHNLTNSCLQVDENMSAGVGSQIDHCDLIQDFHKIALTKPTTEGQIESEMVEPASSDSSSPICGIIKTLQNSARIVLSPIDSNIGSNLADDFSFVKEKIPMAASGEDCQSSCKMFGTPLDKFNSHSSNLKSSLAQEYIDFLNSASREELQALKGIGQKRADYIVQLRETSLLNSLSDLEKIGMSSRQVADMFRKAMRGIFG